MNLRSAGVAALREAARRRPVAEQGKSSKDAAQLLRSIFYPEQSKLFARDPTRKRRATKKTRRAGATAGGVREFLARAIEQPDWRGTYLTDTKVNARKRAWENDSKSGFVDVLRKIAGKRVPHRSLESYRFGGIVIEIRDGDLVLDFSNGSQIEMRGADSLSDHTDMRGIAKHVIWVDEAQDFPFLDEFYSGVMVGCLTDTKGDAWLTGTPGRDLAGMFYEITKEEENERMAGWDVHVIEATNNPFFGTITCDDDVFWIVDNVGDRTGPFFDRVDADEEAIHVRWENTAGLAMRENHWTGDEPDYIREQLGKWVKADARYVYPVHGVPDHVLLFAPQRLADNPFAGTDPRFAGHPRWYDHHAAYADLPRPKRGHGSTYQWLFGLWVDFGFHPDPMAIVVGAFTPALPDIYEMFSWKCTRVHPDDQAAYLKLIWDQIDANIVSFVGDPAGKQADFAMWQSRMNLPIEEARKKGKNELEEFLAHDVRRGRVHLRIGSPLLLEMRNLVYLPGKPGRPREVHKHRKVNGVIHGDHACDAFRYGYADLTHYLAQLPQDKPAAGTLAAYALEAERTERGVEERERQRMDELGDEIERTEIYGGNSYEW